MESAGEGDRGTEYRVLSTEYRVLSTQYRVLSTEYCSMLSSCCQPFRSPRQLSVYDARSYFNKDDAVATTRIAKELRSLLDVDAVSWEK
jgi:hypothetical protein